MDFAAVAHDLRTPLNVILGHMQMLRIEQLSETMSRRLDKIETEVRRAFRLLDGFATSGNRLAAPARIDLDTTIRNAVAELDVMLQRRRIEVRLHVDGLLPTISGDADALHRVLVNLIVNAADAVAADGRITVRARPQSMPDAPVNGVQVDISDTGAGIPRELVARVFDYGFTTKPSGHGTGLGLWICREIVHMHGGRIDVSSTPGRGTTVRLVLPASGDGG
jgi:two-component system, NtrC family, sensor kinase